MSTVDWIGFVFGCVIVLALVGFVVWTERQPLNTESKGDS